MNIAKMNSWEFDSDTKTIHQDSAARHQHFITSTKIHDAPESIIKENIIAPSSVSAFRNLFRLAENERETSHSAEIQLFGHNRKEYKWERIILTPLSKSQGQSNRFLGTSIDITEQKRLQENYVNELNLMENLSSPNLAAKGRYGLKSNKLEYFQTNKNSIDFQNITTYDEGMMATASLCIDPIQKNEFISIFSRKNLLAKFKKGINDFSYTYRRKALDGSSFWCRTQGKLFVDPSSNEEKCFIFSYDINTSKIQQEMISTVIQLNYDYLIIINIHENTYRMFTTMNGYQSSIHQNEVMEYEKSMETYAKKSVVPDEIEKNIHDMSIANIIEQLDSKDSFSSFVNIVCSNGKTARKLLQFSYIDKSDGLVLLSRIDVSESYRQEQLKLKELQKANAEAEAAKLSAEQANIVKTQFLSRMSHDLRTPMNAIIGLSFLAKDEIENPTSMSNYISSIEKAGKFLLGLVNDCLDFEKLSDHKMMLNPEPYSFEEFKQNIQNIIIPLCNNKNITLIFNELSNLHVIVVDKIRFEQIFLNLLSNAIKFTPNGGTVRVTAAARISGIGKLLVQISVQDNGIGMSEEFQKHVFEPFEQEVDYSTKNKTEGTGLGLSIVKNLVELMGGTVNLKSKLGEGSTFTISLEVPMVEREDNPHMAKEAYDPAILNGRDILLVEDHPMNTNIAMQLLQRQGMKVTCASNGEKGVRAFADSKPGFFSAVLMDIRMPLMDGYEAARAIRNLAREDAKSVPIIAMSANAFEEDINKSLEAGMNVHLSKPIDPSRLFASLSHWISLYENKT